MSQRPIPTRPLTYWSRRQIEEMRALPPDLPHFPKDGRSVRMFEGLKAKGIVTGSPKDGYFFNPEGAERCGV